MRRCSNTSRWHVEQTNDVEPADALQCHDWTGIGENDGNIDDLFFLLGHMCPSGDYRALITVLTASDLLHSISLLAYPLDAHTHYG